MSIGWPQKRDQRITQLESHQTDDIAEEIRWFHQLAMQSMATGALEHNSRDICSYESGGKGQEDGKETEQYAS